MPDSTRICFVRHAETDWNLQMRIQGHMDLPLNAAGEAQADAVGRRFTGAQAAALYSSDLLRTRQTASGIGVALGLPVINLPAFRERHFGCFEGMTFEEVAAQSRADFEGFECRHPDYTPPGGESLMQLQARVLDGVGQLVAAHPGQVIVVVTHGGVLDVINRHARGLPLDAPRDFGLPNTGINWVDVTGGQWQIQSWGETKHLEKQEA